MHHIHELVGRYNLTRQAVNDRINVLGIKRVERGAISFEDLGLMDEYHNHIRSGGTIENFPRNPEVIETVKVQEPEQDLAIQEENQINDSINFVAIIEMLTEVIKSSSKSTINKYDELYMISLKGYAVGTSAIKELTGAKPIKNEIRFGSFLIKKAKHRLGKEKSWHVHFLPESKC